MADVHQEVSEDLRREQLKQLWNRYGRYVIAVAVLIVVAVAGYQILESQRKQRSADSGDRYQAAVELYNAGDLEAAEAAFLAVAEDGYDGYPSLSRMSAAGIQAELGDVDSAAANFDAVAIDPETDPALSDAARVRAALLVVDTEPFEGIRQRLEPFTESGSPYRIVALEILAVAAIRAGDNDLARDLVTAMFQDPLSTQDSSQRASVLFSYILAQTPVQAPAAPAAALPLDLLGPGFDPAAPGFNLLAPGFNPAAPVFNPAAPGFNPAAPGFDLVAPGVSPAAPGIAVDTPPAVGDPAAPPSPAIEPAVPDGSPAPAPAAE